MFVKNYHHGDKWLPGMIQKKTGPVSFVVKLTDGRVRRCHQDQLRRRSVEVHLDSPVDSEVSVSPAEVSLPLTFPTEPSIRTPESDVEGPSAMDPTLVTKDAVVTAIPSNLTEKAYPKRTRTPVIRFEPTW